MRSVLPNPSLRQGFASLCPCQDYSLEVFTGDKDWLFLLLLQFLRANRAGCRFLNWNPPMLPQEMQSKGWLTVNFQPGAHLSPTLLVP